MTVVLLSPSACSTVLQQVWTLKTKTAQDTCCSSHWLHVLQYWQAVELSELCTCADDTDNNWEPNSAVDSTSKGKHDGSLPSIYISPPHYAGGTHTLRWHSW
jgi:hypothetical protein